MRYIDLAFGNFAFKIDWQPDLRDNVRRWAHFVGRPA